MANITLYKETDQDITFQWYETDGTTERSLVGATVYFTVKANQYDSDADDSDAIISKDVTSHTTPATGFTTITLTDEDTDVTPNSYYYDIKVKESDGKIYYAQSGKCTVVGTPTNRAN